MRLLLATALLLLSTAFAQQQPRGCYYNGNFYPVGTVIGGLTCQPDGTWR